MVFSYAPCDVTHLSDILNICYLATKTISPYEQRRILLDLLDNNFCKHIIKKNKNKNKLCLRKHKNEGNYCSSHAIKEPIYLKKCKGNTTRGKPCQRNVRKFQDFCNYCIKKNINNNTHQYNCNINYRYLVLVENIICKNSGPLVRISNYIPFYEKIKSVLCRINIYVLFYILNLLSELSKKMRIHSASNSEMQVVLYNHNVEFKKYYFLDSIYKYINKNKYENCINTLKKYNFSKLHENIYYEQIQKENKRVKNKKKNKKRRLKLKEKKRIEKNKIDLFISYSPINTKYIVPNVFDGIIIEDYVNLMKWPLKKDSYKEICNYEIAYFHCFINIKTEDTQKVKLFYYKNDELNNISITYKKLHNLLITEYNSYSVLEFIKKYFKNFIK